MELYQWGMLGVLVIGYLPTLLVYQRQRGPLFVLGYTAMTLGSIMTVVGSFHSHLFITLTAEAATVMAGAIMLGSAYIGQKRLKRLEEGAKLGGVRAWKI